MSLGGGRVPFDPATALAGPARVLYAPISAAVPVDMYDIVPGVADGTGEYPAEGDWLDFGLAADAPTYNHSRETEGLEYEQSAGVLFEQISEISRTFTVNIAGISPENMKIVENTASAIETIAAADSQAGQKKIAFGTYTSLQAYRIAMITFRPDGSTVVQEDTGGPIRPAAVALVLPRVVLGAEDSEFSFGAGEPASGPIAFNVIDESTLDAGEEQGYWVFEDEGVIAVA